MAFTFGQLVESILILMVFFMVYSLFFSRQASFITNRFILLVGIISSIIIPFININTPAPNQLNFYIELKAVEVFANGSEVVKNSSFYSFSQILGYIYVFGILIFSAKFFYQLIQMSTLFFRSEIVKIPQGKIVYTNREHPVFSFLWWIFISSKSEHGNQLDIILNHEKVHIKQKHSIDLLLLELLAIVQWINPFVWLYRNLVRQNHEFIADRVVIRTGIPDDTYQELLLGNYKSLKLGFANSFNHSLTFKRLVMMKKNISNKQSVIKLLIIIPIVLTSVYFISCSKSENSSAIQNESTDLQKKNAEIKEPVTITENGKTATSVPLEQIADEEISNFPLDVKPVYPGGDKELIKYIVTNTVYPKIAKEKGIQGTVYVRFVITKTGEVAQPKVMRAADPLLEEEAIRVVKSLPKWKPGEKEGKPVNVWFIIPVKFKLQ